MQSKERDRKGPAIGAAANRGDMKRPSSGRGSERRSGKKF